jgi:hypothetical protein
MELPPALRQEVDLALTGVPLADLARAAEALSRRSMSARGRVRRSGPRTTAGPAWQMRC